MQSPLIKILRRDAKVMVRLEGLPHGAAEGVSMTREEAQCACNAISRMLKDDQATRMRFGPLQIVSVPGHRQPIELHYSDSSWKVIVDLTRTEAYTVSDMLRAAGVTPHPFTGETDLQDAPRVQGIRHTPLPDSITTLLAVGPVSLSDEAEEPEGPAAPAPDPTPSRPRASTRHDRPRA